MMWLIKLSCDNIVIAIVFTAECGVDFHSNMSIKFLDSKLSINFNLIALISECSQNAQFLAESSSRILISPARRSDEDFSCTTKISSRRQIRQRENFMFIEKCPETRTKCCYLLICLGCCWKDFDIFCVCEGSWKIWRRLWRTFYYESFFSILLPLGERKA